MAHELAEAAQVHELAIRGHQTCSPHGVSNRGYGTDRQIGAPRTGRTSLPSPSYRVLGIADAD